MKSSNIFRDDKRTATLFQCIVAGLAFMCLMQASCALDPAKSLSQYVHSEWGKDKGFVGGTIYAICQSGDGYLWLGTDRGLVRFDGEKFTLIQRPFPGESAIGPVRGLVADSDGNLWIRPEGPQMLVYHDGQFKNVFASGGLPMSTITAMSGDGHGDVLFSGLESNIMRSAHGKIETIADSTEASGTIISMAETLDGRIWLGTRDSGLLVIKNGKPVPRIVPNLENDKINALAAAFNGALWVGTDQGLRFVSEGRDIHFTPPEWNRNNQILGVTTDNRGNVWAAGSRGLVRVTQSGEFSLLPGDSKKTMNVSAVYEDRSGTIWFGGADRLERLQDGFFATYSSRDGLPASNGGALYVDGARRIWFAPVSGGLYVLDKAGQPHRIQSEGLDRDVVYSISGKGNDIWIGRQHGGLTRITLEGDSVSSQTYTNVNGLAQNTVFATYAARDGTVWAGTISGGLSRLKDGTFTNYSMSNGLSSNAVNSIVKGYDGTVWVGTSAGLDAFRNGRWAHWTMSDGLPSSEVRNCFEDAEHVLWVITASGLAHLSSGKPVVPNHLPEVLRDQLFGIAEDGFGFLWLSTSDHVVRVNRDRLLADALHENDVQMMGQSDGLIGAEGVRRDRSILTGPDGKIWVSVQNGIAFADPGLSLRELRPLSVRIESITAAGTTFRAHDSPQIPARTHSVTIQFSGASLDSPERIWYRYLLEGADQTWSDPVQMRQVAYHNLHAGTYRFRAMASYDGVLWNGPGGEASFTIDQAFWETWWFRTGWLFLAAVMVIVIIRLRMLRLSRQLNSRFKERLAERTRIAQELHDTLLQSFQGLMLRFQTVESMLPARPHEAKAMLDDALDRADDALAESREAIQNIRSFPPQPAQLTRALASLLEQVKGEFSHEGSAQPNCSVVVEGSERTLRENVTLEIYRIAREALRNAFQHAQASQLEIEVSFRDVELRLSFRDDGAGIEPSVLKDGERSGHWGLIGMRERATRIGADLSFWSKPGAGTEVALAMPGDLAYASARLNLFRRIHNRIKA